ncbi:hypothetical protein EVAR_55307_1 [Eumeta japonica]|uniref:Uncharacterized protein n=1 Tax=Eumeta variegata TaxID=151549 RepID=A0A4C1SR86_EUMVA|nr:hypothetical protein EVAR_55307_1 [Eumeta japonica]
MLRSRYAHNESEERHRVPSTLAWLARLRARETDIKVKGTRPSTQMRKQGHWSRQEDHAAPGRGAPPPKRGAKGAGGRSETSVLAKARQGAAKKLAKPATPTLPVSGGTPLVADPASHAVPPSNTQPRLSLTAGEGGIEMPSQTETPEGAFVALEAVGGFARRVAGGFTAFSRAAVKITALAREAKDELEALRNISKEVKASVCEKLQCIAELALRLEESRSRHILEVEREKAKRTRDLEAAERRLQKAMEHHLDRCLRVEAAAANMAADITRTQEAIDKMDIPNKLEGLHKALEVRPQVPGPKIGATRTLIVSSRCANHTSDQVVKAIRAVVDARKMGLGVDRVRKARNQKVVLTCASDDAIKRIETHIKIRAKDLQVSKPEPSLPLIVIRDALKISSD